MPRGRIRKPAARIFPGQAGAEYLRHDEIERVLDLRFDLESELAPHFKSLSISPSRDEKEILRAWPFRVLHVVERLFAVKEDQGFAWIYQQDPLFASKLLETFTRVAGAEKNTAPEDWNWEQLAWHLPTFHAPEDENAEAILRGEGEPDAPSPLAWNDLVEIAREHGCGTKPDAHITPSSMNAQSFAQRIPEVLQRWQNTSSKWSPRFHSWLSVPTNRWESALPILPGSLPKKRK